jgi:hypothetical protein
LRLPVPTGFWPTPYQNVPHSSLHVAERLGVGLWRVARSLVRFVKPPNELPVERKAYKCHMWMPADDTPQRVDLPLKTQTMTCMGDHSDTGLDLVTVLTVN